MPRLRWQPNQRLERTQRTRCSTTRLAGITRFVVRERWRSELEPEAARGRARAAAELHVDVMTSKR